MLELLAPAGSPEAILAAVQNGANAVYLGLDAFNARRNAKNFTEENIAKTIAYCHIRGVKVYVTFNTLATDRELVRIERMAKNVSRAGADALIVQDLGVMRVLRQALPEMPLHASTQMSVWNLEGARRAHEAGASRVILARELSVAHIAYIAKHAPCEVEVFAHGALCMAYSGQCYMSAAIGGRSGNRGLCAQPCRLQYTIENTTGAYLSLKDLCLAQHIADLEKAGVTCLKIEGRMKRPEYTAIVTRVYSDAIHSGKPPNEQEMQQLETAFSREGFTDAYLRGKKGADMFGVRKESNRRESPLFAETRNIYTKMEAQLVPVKFYVIVAHGKPAQFAVSDREGRIVRLEGPMPEAALHREITEEQIQTQLAKTGGTPYLCEDVQVKLQAGLSLPLSQINEMRRNLLDELSHLREEVLVRSEGIFRAGEPAPQRSLPPQLNVSLLRADQLSDEFVDLKPSLIYLPLGEILEHTKQLRPYLEREHIKFCAVLPRVILDNERDEVKRQLFEVQGLGISECMVSNMGDIALAKKQGIGIVRGDSGLNVFNAQALKTLDEMGLASATVSFELKMAQIRDMSKEIDLELIAYGRLPLMITENCVMQHAKVRDGETPVKLSDRMGISFPIVKEANCRNVILNSKKLFLADRDADYMSIGLWGARLVFTTENARECRAVLERYLGVGGYEPGEFTRGLYYRGVE